MQTQNFETKIKERKLVTHFEEYHHALQEIISRGEDIHYLVLHDFCSDVKEEELTQITSSFGPSMAKLKVIKTFVAMNSLSDEDRLIIKEDFIKPNNRHWWTEYYTRSKYYRKRQKAIDRFYVLISD